ncbi:RNA methyltransferase, TrmA family [Thermocrinis albus DSM 14484]|uniref:RNA methyltransferase, TrmA family n=1 Tax=Thermocrinis albus (strain DSM 14484 / JCM 11386 / HI 11/12) TaxID=638303 RepID=D3SM23_THEAH|nr:class I SAM-dependent RNA methyltransferase [Thermocrinis albus]ADC89803.1 RNA methyltransferase, TrmA family [Thermocrinis albus DSM 14484]
MKGVQELKIQKLVYGGYGFATGEDGRVYLVRYAAPGEVVRAQIIREKRDYSEATVEKVIIPSGTRRNPPCRYYTHCGGCQIQHMDYSAQLEAKNDILLDNLKRIGKLQSVNLGPPVVSGSEFHYRLRVQFKVEDGKVGFFAWGTHQLVDIEECLLVHRDINQIIPTLRELSRQVKDLREIHVLYSPWEKEFLLKLVTVSPIDKDRLRKLKELYIPPQVVGVGNYTMLRDTPVRRYFLGRDFTFIQVGPYRYRVSADSFLQVNYTLYEEFVNAVLEKVQRVRKAVEIHCGIGFFSLPLSQRAEFLYASDVNQVAVRDAQYSARINSVDKVVFVHERAVDTLKNLAGEVIDLLVVDPPREGLSEGETQLILSNKPKNIVYVSCNPSTLARDLKVLSKGGYSLKVIRLVDNFPQTYHVESVSFLELS